MANTLQQLPLNSGIDPRQVYAALYGQQIDPAAAAQQPAISPGMTYEQMSNPQGGAAPASLGTVGDNLFAGSAPGVQSTAPAPAAARAGEISAAFLGGAPP
ncbi:MAG: hypothetical protein WAO35_13395, partial [Terriglobia bacterium]